MQVSTRCVGGTSPGADTDPDSRQPAAPDGAGEGGVPARPACRHDAAAGVGGGGPAVPAGHSRTQPQHRYKALILLLDIVCRTISSVGFKHKFSNKL